MWAFVIGEFATTRCDRLERDYAAQYFLLNMIVYWILCIKNGKMYVGKTTKTLKDRWDGHCRPGRKRTYFARAVQKYGKANFIKAVLWEGNDLKEMDRMEKEYIKLLNTTDSNIGYNITAGGGGVLGYRHSPETLEKMRQAALGNKNGFGGINPYTNAGIKHSEATRKKMREAWARRKQREMLGIQI